MSREAMRMALEALELYLTMDTVEESHLLEVDIAPKVIAALKERLK
jgi:predicted RNase H-like HicB family nuclease